MPMLIHTVNILFQIYTLMLFVRILASWIPQANEYRIIQFIGYYTDPYLNVFRRIIPPLGMFDISPIVAFLCLSFLQNILLNLLFKMV